MGNNINMCAEHGRRKPTTCNFNTRITPSDWSTVYFFISFTPTDYAGFLIFVSLQQLYQKPGSEFVLPI